MAPLQLTLDTLDGVDDSIKSFYLEKDGKYVLDLDGQVNNDDPNKIPKSRLDAEIQKRKAADSSLKDISDGFVESVPEEMRDIIPDLPPAAKIKWIQTANAKGLFNPKGTPPVDTKKPGDKAPQNFDGLSPQAIMAQGYKSK